MFTGIVERVARVTRIDPIDGGLRLVVGASPSRATADRGNVAEQPGWEDLEVGESIAVNGVCLTLLSASTLSFDVVPETLRCTNLGELVPGSLVNLERSLRVGSRLGGHYVLGHIDTTGVVTELTDQDQWKIVRVTVDEPKRFRTVPKGSAAIDGISLTVVDRGPNWFTVALIPHTLRVTTFGERSVGDRVNLEMDHFGKWVEELYRGREGPTV